MHQIICCQNKLSKLSDCNINHDTTSLMIHFDNDDSIFVIDKFNFVPLYIERLHIYAKFINNKCSGTLDGNVYEALLPVINLKRLTITMITDNTNWDNFDKLLLKGISIRHHENVHNQIVFPPSSKYVIFNAFEIAINKSPHLCKDYMMKAFKNKPVEVFWEWSVNCNYNSDYMRIYCLIDNSYKIRIYGEN